MVQLNVIEAIQYDSPPIVCTYGDEDERKPKSQPRPYCDCRYWGLLGLEKYEVDEHWRALFCFQAVSHYVFLASLHFSKTRMTLKP